MDREISALAKRPLNILMIDDDELDRELVRRLLSQVKARVWLDEASHGDEAFERIGKQPFDCIIVDYLLPGGSCMDLLQRLMGASPDSAFVVLTGHGDETVAVEMMKAGIADYIPKDHLDAERFWKAIQYSVSMRRSEVYVRNMEALRRRQAERFRSLVHCAPAVAGAISLEELTTAAAEKLREVLGCEVAAARIVSDGDVNFYLAGAPGSDRADSTAWEQLCRVAAHPLKPERRPLDANTDVLVIGLHARGGKDVGVLAILDNVQPRADLPGTYGSSDGEQENRANVFCQMAQIVAATFDSVASTHKAERALQTRDDVMAVVSHDLRMPLTNIKLGVQLLREGAAAADTEVLDRIDRGVSHMNRLVEDLVDMVRIEGGKVDLHRGPERVKELLDTVTSHTLHLATAAGLHYRVAYRDELTVLADRYRLVQALDNIVGNAIKFTPRGGSVELGAKSQNQEVLFWVRDTGPGIAESESGQVFVRYWRSDPKRRQGLGLGLFIAKGMISAHGGSIWFESHPGEGTTFFVTIPVWQPQDTPPPDIGSSGRRSRA